ncbi:MAG: thiamine-phosphate kinase [Candidatus Sumerlaeaceae bacterium]|jgi:thiamine-monophosphate kinase
MNENKLNQTLAEVGERELLRLLTPYLDGVSDDVLVGVGDDAAVLSAQPFAGQCTILTADMLIEGTHFPCRPHADWQRLGIKAMVSNLSDVAAMGGQPRYALISVGFPCSLLVREVLELYEGLSATARGYGVSIIGGDTVGASAVVISLAVLGVLPANRRPALRSACRPGQRVYVSGTLGESAAGLQLILDPKLKSLVEPTVAESLVTSHWVPTPRIALGQALSILCPDLAMIDISDSLYHELSVLAEASHVGFQLNLAALPRSAELESFCHAIREPIDKYLLFSGEEYELLFCTSLAPEDLLSTLAGMENIPSVTPIGIVTDQPNAVEFLNEDGRPVAISDETFEHFERRPGAQKTF